LFIRDLARSGYHRGISRLPLSARRRILFTLSHRRLPNFTSPQTFNEKVNWRIINDRRPLLAWTCDKQKMKEYVTNLSTEVYVPRTLWIGRDLAQLTEVELPERWVLKPNHGSGAVHFGFGRHAPVDDLLDITRGWLDNDRPPAAYGEWAYFQAERALMVEEWLGEGEEVPADYKFFVFDGRPLYLHVNRNRFRDRVENFYSADWTPQLCNQHSWPTGKPQPRPERLDEMLQIAGAIGSGFDFLRVDLYATNTGVAFGEVTPYPTGGLDPFKPRRFDRQLGAPWTLPSVVVNDPTASARG
jgi:hypothetical protein